MPNDSDDEKRRNRKSGFDWHIDMSSASLRVFKGERSAADKKSMHFTISDNVVSEFLSGLFAVFALIGVGAFLMLLLGRMEERFPFTRLALVLALSPLCLARFLETDGGSILNLYAMIVMLLGITIDGIAHLITPKAVAKAEVAAAEVQEDSSKEQPKPGMIVWEKAE